MSFEQNAQNTAEPLERESNRVKVLDINEQPTTISNIKVSNCDQSFNFENGKLNALQREGSHSKYSPFYKRPPSSVIEEAIVEADEVENFTVPGQSKTSSSSPNVAEIPSKKEDGRLLARRSACKLVMRPSSQRLGIKLDHSNITEKSIERNLFWQETLPYKDTTSSRLRKQSSKGSVIGLSLKET